MSLRNIGAKKPMCSTKRQAFVINWRRATTKEGGVHNANGTRSRKYRRGTHVRIAMNDRSLVDENLRDGMWDPIFDIGSQMKF